MFLFFAFAVTLLSTTTSAEVPWTIVSPNVATVITGIACTSNKTCYIPADVNGVGTQILRSQDGGISWRPSHSEPFALLLLDITASGKNVAVLGALSLMYSDDLGVNFNESLAPLGAGQCIRNVGQINSPLSSAAEVGFGAVGDFGLFSESNGVALSVDGGKTYKAENITVIVADSRYGAFPTDTVFYVAAGDWPGEGADDDPCDDPPCARRGSLFKRQGDLVDSNHYTTLVPNGSRLVKTKGSRLHLLQSGSETKTLQWAVVKREFVLPANAGPYTGPNITSWEAQIAKSEDAGKTWTRVFSKFGAYYLNDIECTGIATCCAVAETGSGTNGTDGGGAYILCTEDGGKTWKEEHVNTDTDASLIGISAIGEKEFWAVGGHLGAITIQYSQFYHSLDAGSTWTRLDDPNGNFTFNYAIDIDCEINDNCWVATLDILTQESSIGRLR